MIALTLLFLFFALATYGAIWHVGRRIRMGLADPSRL